MATTPVRLSNFSHDAPHVIDASALVTLMSCPRKFMFQKSNKLKPPGESIHLVAGGAFAAGIEMYRRRVFFHDEFHMDAMEHAFVAAAKHWGDFGHDPERTKTKPFISVVKALEAYVRHFSPRSDPVRPVFDRLSGEPSVEFSFALPLDDFTPHPSGDPYILAGRFDLLGRDTRTGRTVFMDEKTTYSLGAGFSDKWKLRWQFLTYTWALNRLGYNVFNGLVRGVGMLKTRTDFMEVPVSFPPHILNEFEHSLRFYVNQISLFAKGRFFPAAYGDGCTNCGFSSLCLNKFADNWVNQFETDHWDPLRVRSSS